MTKRRTTTIPRRTITVDIDTIRVEREYLVLEDWTPDMFKTIRIEASPWAVEFLAEKCVEWLRVRRNEADLKIKAIAGECAK